MIQLPVDDVLPNIATALKRAKALVLEAPPGAGKSTRVPPFMLDHVEGEILVLEPRRVAARAVAARIAQERGVKLGQEIGYQVRFDRRTSSNTRLSVITEGILTRRLLADPFLEGVGLVILDEFHERSIHTDLAIAFLKEAMHARDDLQVIVMSATLGTAQVADYLDAPVIVSQGQLFPLSIQHGSARLVDRLRNSRDLGPLIEAVQSAVHGLIQDPADDGGDILVFLPGAREIQACVQDLKVDAECVPLYGAMSAEAQDRALCSGPKRRVILATNIAETSLTIPGVRAVVDSGLARTMRASPSTGFDVLETVRISKASARQRAGRAGRLGPGRVVRLWSEQEEHQLADYDEPDVARIDLTSAVLDVWAWSGRSAREFDWFDLPDGARIDRAEKLLSGLGALRAGLTPTGQEMVKMSMHPRLARCMVEARRRGCEGRVAPLLAILSEPDFVLEPPTEAWPSDALWRAQLLENPGRVRVHEGRRQSIRALSKSFGSGELGSLEDALKCLATGYPDRIGFRRQQGYALSGGFNVELARDSVLKFLNPELCVAHEILDTTGKAYVRMGSAVEEAWLPELFEDLVEERVEGGFDHELERVVARRTHRFMGLVYRSSEASTKSLDPVEVAQLLMKAASKNWERAFGLNEEDLQVLERLEFLAHYMPELQLPNLGGLEELLAQSCWGKSSFKELRNLPFAHIVLGALSYQQRQALDERAPSKINVPSGRSHKIQYKGDESPVLAVRIQELFGWPSVPLLAGGRVPITLHLLAPNSRPQQVTSDLKSFWETTYPEVRKELRARYPKHSWPEDPTKAEATHRIKPRT